MPFFVVMGPGGREAADVSMTGLGGRSYATREEAEAAAARADEAAREDDVRQRHVVIEAEDRLAAIAAALTELTGRPFEMPEEQQRAFRERDERGFPPPA